EGFKMSYHSKRTISTLSTDASKRPKPTPPLVSQSFTAANAINSPPPHTEANDCRELKELIKPIPPKDTHTSSQMPSFSSKAPTKWGPFCPPSNGVPTTLSPSFGTDGVTKMNSIWKTHPGTFNQIPQATKPLGSSVGDAKQSSINQSSMKTKSATSKSKMGMSNQNIDGNQMHIGSSTTTFSRDTYDKKVVKPPDHQEGGGQAAYMQQEGSRRTTYMQQQGSEQTRDKTNSSKSFKTRRPFKIYGWLTDVEYDAKEEVITVDANGKLQFVSGSIQPIDILSNKGVKYYVEFNEFHQPIRKGGHILVRFLGYITKMAHYCPIGAITWHDVEKNLKVQIVNKMREHFIIPDDEVYDTLAQQRVGKCWRHYKHELKKTFFQPDKKTHEQHYDLVPSGHSRSDWIKLVDHWFSPKGQKLSQIGKEARSASMSRSRTWKKMGLVEAWERSHMRKDKSFDDAKAKVESLKLANSSCSSVDVEDEAFYDLMNGGNIPERPQGFGFGVKKSDVYGVRGLLRKEGSKKVKTRCKNEVLEKENRELSRKNDEYTNTLKAVVTQFSQILDVVRNGKALVQLIDAAQSALHMAIPEVIFLNFLFRFISLSLYINSGGGKGSRLEPAPGKGGGGGGWGNGHPPILKPPQP
ncbi:DNA replication licensing factor mcm4, partial [Bienertia sinuspersici]